jgi:hypothetical protein
MAGKRKGAKTVAKGAAAEGMATEGTRDTEVVTRSREDAKGAVGLRGVGNVVAGELPVVLEVFHDGTAMLFFGKREPRVRFVCGRAWTDRRRFLEGYLAVRGGIGVLLTVHVAPELRRALSITDDDLYFVPGGA